MSKRSRSNSTSDTEGAPSGSQAACVVVPSHHDPTPRKLVDVETAGNAPQVMRCTLPPHRSPIDFSSYEDYEVHYAQSHVNRCSQCRKNFPTTHYLTLHIEENHDPLAEARRARGEKTYRCFVEGCDKICSTPQKRRMHLIDKHAFPKMYNFYVINDGLDRHHSLLREERRNRAPAPGKPNSQAKEGRLRYRDCEEEPAIKSNSKAAAADNGALMDVDVSHADGIKDLTTSMSALKFVPNSVRIARTKK